MAVEMIMPKVDMDQETGMVVEWLKGDGQRVEEGETILVVETNKITIDIEAPATGILAHISAHPGDTAPIGTVIAYILEDGEELAGKTNDDSVPQVEIDPDSIDTSISVTPIAKEMAVTHGVDLSKIDGSGVGGKITKRDIEIFLAQKPTLQKTRLISATPYARRTARELGANLKDIKGSGPGGRIQKIDVERYLAQIPQLATPTETIREIWDTIPVTGMRRTISERISESYQGIPHIRLTTKIDMTNFNNVRDEYNKIANKDSKQETSVTALLVKLVSIVLTRHRMLNSSLIVDKIILYKDINIGVAVALDKGLIVPVVKHVDQKDIHQITIEVNDLITRAREEKLTTPDVKGGTFTISNLGPFGVEQFDPIINPPEAGILAVGSTTQEAVPMPDGMISVRPIARMTLSADHRIVDGTVAAKFISELKSTIESLKLVDL